MIKPSCICKECGIDLGSCEECTDFLKMKHKQLSRCNPKNCCHIECSPYFTDYFEAKTNKAKMRYEELQVNLKLGIKRSRKVYPKLLLNHIPKCYSKDRMTIGDFLKG